MRVAVVGSGPAGFYAAGALLSADPPAEVDLIERLRRNPEIRAFRAT